MDKLNFYKSTIQFLSTYENKINNKLEEITILIKEKYRNLKFLLPIIKVLKKNPNMLLLTFLLLCLVFLSNIVNLFFTLILIDAIVLSLLIFNNTSIKFNARKLARNVLSLFILYTNILGNIISLILVILMFNDSSKFIKSFIINFLGKVINFIFSFFPIIKEIYPSISELNSDVIIESTSESKESFTEASKTIESTS
jgi:hypothetical protein